jgi:hypothetical protein
MQNTHCSGSVHDTTTVVAASTSNTDHSEPLIQVEFAAIRQKALPDHVPEETNTRRQYGPVVVAEPATERTNDLLSLGKALAHSEHRPNDNVVDRRLTPRSYSDFNGTVQVLDCNKTLNTCILDLSDEGLAIYSPQPLCVGAPVAVTYRGVLILAEVVYCIPFEAGCRAGVKINQAMATVTAEGSVDEVTRELRSALMAMNGGRRDTAVPD